jgi:hypothetical protein
MLGSTVSHANSFAADAGSMMRLNIIMSEQQHSCRSCQTIAMIGLGRRIRPPAGGTRHVSFSQRGLAPVLLHESSGSVLGNIA